MAVKGLKGYGGMTLNGNSPLNPQDLAYFPRLNKFTLSKEIEFQIAKAFSQGDAVLRNADVVSKSEDAMLTIEMQSIDKMDMEFLFNEFSQTTASVTVPIYKSGIIPASTAYEISDTDLVGLTASDIKVTLISTGAGDEKGLTVVATAPADATEVQLDDTLGKLVFHSSLANRGIAYFVNVTYTNKETIGIESSPRYYDSLSFTGIIDGPRFPNGMLLYIPKMDRHKGFELDISGETTLSLEYKPTIVGANRDVFQIIFL